MKKGTTSTAKSEASQAALQSLNKLIGKRTRSIVLINNIEGGAAGAKEG